MSCHCLMGKVYQVVISFIYLSHVLEVCDRVSVFKYLFMN